MPRPRFALCALLFSCCLCCPVLAPARAAGPATYSTPDANDLTLTEALDHAAQNRPELEALHADLTAAGLKLKHAGLPLNPELGVEWDNLGGNLPPDEGRETTVSLSQPLEIGGKRVARRDRVQAEIERLRREQATVWLDIAAEVRMAFVEVLGARERLALQRETEQIATELAGLTHERVAAGELAATEETRSEARRAETMAETQRCQRLLSEAELALALALVEPDNAMVTAAGTLPQEVAIPERQTLLAGMHNSPLLALRRSESALATAGRSLEAANAWADPALSLALRDLPGREARAVSVGISIPLPLFQRNQAALAEAGAVARKATINQEATARRLRTELIKAHAQLTAIDHEARTLRREVLSRATEAALAVQEGFRFGKFRYSDVLEASHSLVSVKTRHLDAILDLNRAAIALDRLQGRPSFPAPSPNPYRSTP